MAQLPNTKGSKRIDSPFIGIILISKIIIQARWSMILTIFMFSIIVKSMEYKSGTDWPWMLGKWSGKAEIRENAQGIYSW